MRGLIVLAMLTASLAHASWSDYEENRELTLDADGVESLSIKHGAGSMDVRGADGSDAIVVEARVIVPDADEDDARKVIEKDMVLSLDQKGSEGRLNAWFDSGFMGLGSDAHIVLDVSVPTGMTVHIDDGSGSIEVLSSGGDLTIDDGSGSITVENVKNVKIDDGSGSIKIDGANGDVSIVDGSGSITVNGVSGSVRVDDGSGSINVSDVEQDFVVVDDGSGSVNHSNVRGNVDAES